MTMEPQIRIFDLPQFRNCVGVFGDRRDAGEVLSRMLAAYRKSSAIVLAIPAGGVPVAAVLARRLELPLDVAVVSKITPPWDPEVGYGAVAFDGTVRINEMLVPRLGLLGKDVERGIEATREKVARRVKAFRGERPGPELARTVILVDDGLASGVTMQVAVEAMRNAQAREIIIAVPTGHESSVQDVASTVDAVYCANLRAGLQFAVAAAYQRWSDVDEQAAMLILTEQRPASG